LIADTIEIKKPGAAGTGVLIRTSHETYHPKREEALQCNASANQYPEEY